MNRLLAIGLLCLLYPSACGMNTNFIFEKSEIQKNDKGALQRWFERNKHPFSDFIEYCKLFFMNENDVITCLANLAAAKTARMDGADLDGTALKGIIASTWGYDLVLKMCQIEQRFTVRSNFEKALELAEQRYELDKKAFASKGLSKTQLDESEKIYYLLQKYVLSDLPLTKAFLKREITGRI